MFQCFFFKFSHRCCLQLCDPRLPVMQQHCSLTDWDRVSGLTVTRGFCHCVIQRIAPQFHRHAAVTRGLSEKYNAVLTASGTPAARRWLPQALVLPTFFRDALVERKTLAMRCVALMVTRRYDVENSFFRSRAYNNRPEGWPG